MNGPFLFRFGTLSLLWLAVLFPAHGAIVCLQNNPTYDYTGTADAWLDESSTSQRKNYGGATNLIVSYDGNDGGYVEDCTVIRFALPSVACSGVHTAELALFYRTAGSMWANNTLGIKPYRLTNDWFENRGTGDRTEGVSWQYRDQSESNAWTFLSGGWYDKIDDGNSIQQVKKEGGTGQGIEPLNWVPFNVRPSLLAWQGGATNCGFVVFSCSFSGTGFRVWAEFDSREFPISSTRPKLTLGYSNALIRWEGAVNGNWTTNDWNWRVDIARARFENGDHVWFEDTTQTNITLASDGVAPLSTTFSNASVRYTLAGGPLSGNGTVFKYRSGDLRLTASNAFSGLFTLTSGRVYIAHAAALGSPSGGTDVRPGASLLLENGVLYQTPEPLTLAGAGYGNQGAFQLLSGTGFFYGPITFSGPASIGVPSNGLLALFGPLHGTNNWTKGGGGTLALAGSCTNTYAGACHVTAGTLFIQKTGNVPAIPGLLRIGGSGPATVQLGSSNPFGPNAALHIEPGGLLKMGSYNAGITNLTMTGGEVNLESGTLILQSEFRYAGTDETARLTGGTLSLDGTFRTFLIEDGAQIHDVLCEATLHNGGLIKQGNGRLTLRAASSYPLGTTVEAGALRVENPAGSATGSGTVTVHAAATVEGTGRIEGTVLLRDNGWIKPGASAGTLTVGELLCADQARLGFELNTPGFSPSNDLLAVNGSLQLAGTLAITPGPSFSPGVYPLITYAGSLSIGSVQFEGIPDTYDAWLVTNTPGLVALEIAQTPEHFVSPQGGNLFPYTNWATAALILQDALDAAKASDTVWVAPGIYDIGGRAAEGFSLTNRALVSTGVTVRSLSGPAVTILVGGPDPIHTNGPGAVRCAWLQPGSALIGFTLSNGFTAAEGAVPDRRGGGAYAQSAVLSQCWFIANGAIEGGGAALQNATVRDSRFRQNRASGGGGLLLDEGSRAINCVLFRNQATQAGGGIQTIGTAQLAHLTVSENEAGQQGGGASLESSVTIKNSIFYFNQAPLNENLFSKVPSPSISYSCTAPLMPGIGNTEEDPRFRDLNENDFHLLCGSPCVDTAILLTPPLTNDVEGLLRPLDGNWDNDPRPDMGAFEYNPVTTDSDRDGIPDDWEQRHGLDPLDPSDAENDTDEDRFTNRQEYIADTDPLSSTSYLRILAISNTTPWSIWFDSSAFRLYQLLCATSLANPVWTPVPGAGPTKGSGKRDHLQDTNERPDRLFYRLRVELP